MLARRTSVTEKAWRAAHWGLGGLWVIVLCLLGACSGPARKVPGNAHQAEPWQKALSPAGELAIIALPATPEGFVFPPDSSLVLVVDGWRPPSLRVSEVQRDGLRAFLQKGGRVLLFGYASALASDLCDTERPVSEPFRWGFDARTAMGRARLGCQVVSGREPELFEGLVAGGAEHTFLFTGGEPCCVPLCSWRQGEPQQGEVLARLATEIDGNLTRESAPVIVRWRVGAGEVLACGLQPDFAHEDATLRENSLHFVRNCVQWLQRERRTSLWLCPLPSVAVPVPEELPATLDRRDLPMQPLLAHWGWQAPVVPAAPDSDPRRGEEILDEVLLPSWLAGADLLEIDACDREKGMPLAWAARDPLKRPKDYRGDSFLPGWTARTFARLGQEAHARGMLLQALLDPSPAGEKTAERLATMRFFARELADTRRLGAGALDGFGVRDWWRDPSGYGLAMLQDFQPGGYLYRAGEGIPEVGGALRAVDAADGGMPGLSVAGVSATWRDGFPGDLFPLGRLDARGESVVVLERAVGGGSAPDWIVQQANDFVRARAGRGGAMWWTSHDPSTLGRRTIEYVHGISQDPLRAAVAMPLSATGSNGYRAAAAGLVKDAQSGFGADVPVPASVHVLQNNWFRLLGSGGALLFDPSGKAQFRAGEALVVSPAFVRTRLFGGRPDADAMRSEDLDLLAEGTRGEGGYRRVADVGGLAAEDRRIPTVLAWHDAPRWPQQAGIELNAGNGYYELRMAPRAVRGRGILIVMLDGVVLHCQPFVEGQAIEPFVVPVHLAKSGMRLLQLAVAEGGALSFDRLRLVRTGDVGAEARVLVPAGYTAELGEQSASSYHAEQIELTTLADFPGFLMRIRCERAVRNLQIERTLQLPSHGELLACGEGENSRSLRSPFVLRAQDASLPDVLIVPLQLSRYEHFTVRDGALQFVSAPESGLEARIGFWLAPRRQSLLLRAVATAIFGALDQPQEFDLGDTGEATVVNDLPVAWTRLVHLRQNARTPYRVRENGWWTWRGAQPAEAGGDWLRLCLLPGDAVKVQGGPTILAQTRPGPGSLHVIAMRDPEPRSVIARVLQPSRLAPPSVVMAADFEEVYVDGQPWAVFAGRTVYLPDRVGTYRIEVRAHRGGAAPHVLSTRAPLRQCVYFPDKRELVLVADGDEQRPVELPFTAILSGPIPTSIDNGEVVADASLRPADAATAAAATAGGVVIRFRSGLTRVHYGE
jgi:hypothetical protein